MRRFIQSWYAKAIALTLVLALIGEIVQPVRLYALTSGPSQPEFQGFTEVDMSQSVDAFSGDFSYQVALMTVPGPNGGYPLNLVYNSGAGMEDEASWVGLGWSLNTGAINRNVRGVPDDFRGPTNDGATVPVNEADYINKSQYMKPNWTVGIGANVTFPPVDPEIYNVPTEFAQAAAATSSNPGSLNLSLKLYYNSYTGAGYTFGLSPSLTTNDGAAGSLSGGVSLSFDANDGPSINPSISFGAKFGKFSNSTRLGMGYSSRQGVTGVNFSNNSSFNVARSKSVEAPGVYRERRVGANIPMGFTLNYAAMTGVPQVNTAMEGFNAGFQADLQFGPTGIHPKTPVGFEGYFSINKVADYMQQGYDYPAYGILHAEDRYDNQQVDDNRALMDFDLEKNTAIHMKTPMLPVPVLTHDIYSVTGGGVGGTFRAYRNDAGVFYDAKASSDFIGLSIGFEFATASGVKVGLDPIVSYTNSYSGKWQSGEDYLLDLMGFKDFGFTSGSTNEVRKTEPYFFRMTNESGVEPSGFSSFTNRGGQGPAMFSINAGLSTYPGYTDLESQTTDPDAVDQLANNDVFGGQNPMTAEVLPVVGGQLYSSASFMNTEAPVRQTLITYKTTDEKTALGDPAVRNLYLGLNTGAPRVAPPYDEVNNPWFSDMTYPNLKDHHIAEFTVITNNGMKYVYATPVYNTYQEEVFFAAPMLTGSAPFQTGSGSPPPRTAVYGGLNTVLQDKKGATGTIDRSFSRNVTGPYTHAHLLSYITSPDYIDVDNNGPSQKDMGGWTKFNYYAPVSVKWRMPVGENTVNYSTGFASSTRDDKGSVTYGEKEIQYLHSVETATHIAIFELGDRSDALGVTDILGDIDNGSNNRQKYLKKIYLFSKNDLSTPIKTVHFVYDYELCPNTPNSEATSTHGKLTLKELYFTYRNSEKGSNNRYRFEYGSRYTDNNNGFLDDAGGTNINLAYSNMQVDRWGNYTFSNDPENPYTEQDRTTTGDQHRKEIAQTWNLTKITLPTGGVIRIDYEMDDYAYVQDQPAMQMFEITGTGDASGNIHWLSSGEAPITDEFQRIYFKPLIPISTSLSTTAIDAEIEKYAGNLYNQLVYFKTWQKLQKPKDQSQWAYDYVTGYARVSGWGHSIVSGVVHPYLTLTATADQTGHAFRNAGFQYLRYSRSDLNSGTPENLNILTLVPMVFDILIQTIELMGGYYNFNIMKGHCKFISPYRPSYLRLYTPDGTKYGGGVRVRKITVSDSWSGESNAQQYGTCYYYDLEDGSSSGVATYEPLLGNDENTMKRPHLYGPDNQFNNNEDAFFQEGPFGENFFPAPSVGYSKVTSVNIVNNYTASTSGDNIRKSADGVHVNTFYTARDFPIITRYTTPQKLDNSQNIPIPIIGTISLQSKGYSQGYYIELNDMHGKPKEAYMYDADFWDKANQKLLGGAPYVMKQGYTYFTDQPYVEGGSCHLNNLLPVQNPDGSEDAKELGIQSEMYSHMAEDKTYTLSGGANIGGGIDPAPYGIFIMVTPAISYGENQARVVTTTKVVQRMGFLKEVFSYQNGATMITKNLLFDAESGIPVLTAVTDDYDNPNSTANDRLVYTQQFPAYWYHKGMGPSYRTYRLRYKGTPTSCPDAKKYFAVGDEVYEHTTGARGWITNVYSTGFMATNQAGTGSITVNGTYTIFRSGYRNQQSVMAGKIISLDKPVPSGTSLFNGIASGYNSNFFHNSSFNSNVIGTASSVDLPAYEVTLCNGAEYKITWSILNIGTSPATNMVLKAHILANPGSPDYDCTRYYYVSGSWTSFIPAMLQLGYVPNDPNYGYLSFGYETSGVVNPISVGSGPNAGGGGGADNFCRDIIKRCIPNVLHADMTEYDDDWDYKDEFKTGAPSGFWTGNNNYITGKRGIWRTKRANLYYVERKQYKLHDNPSSTGTTSLRKDGVYKTFVLFDHDLHLDNDGIPEGNADNVQAFDGWRWAAEVPRYGYSPFGFEIENRNPLNIYSSALYGYGNSVPTAVVNNANYVEFGYDGFEEAPTTTYASYGHINFSGSGISLSSTQAHTGQVALKTTGSSVTLSGQLVNTPADFTETATTIQLAKSKKYVVSFWYYHGYSTVNFWTVQFKTGSSATSLGTGVTTAVPLPNNTPAIEGWRRAEFVLDMSLISGTPTYAGLVLTGSSFPLYIDDVRIYPYDANMTSYVYDPYQLRLSAQLDQNNFATFYNYDQEGNLVQVKKETERGIMTVQQTRKHIQQ